MMKLAHFEKLNDIRKNKAALFASLTAEQVEILDKVASGGSCFGAEPGKGDGRVVLDAPGRKDKDSKFVDQKVVNSMLRAGWLRFAEAASVKGSGYFWMTDSAERVWRELGRKVR